MKAIIMAAGKSTRLLPLTENINKSMLKVGGRVLLEYQLENLKKCGIEDIVIIVGHCSDQMREYFGDGITYIENKEYLTTNNLYSLLCARDEMKDNDFIYLHGDIICHVDIVSKCIESERDICLMIDGKKCIEEEMRVVIKDNLIQRVNKSISIEEASGEFIGIAKFSKEGTKLFMEEGDKIIKEGDINAYFAHAITRIAQNGHKIDIALTKGLPWFEIDFKEDLEIVERDILPRIEKDEKI